MAVAASQVSVGTSATSLLASGVAGLRAILTNAGTESVFLGPSDVTTSTGYELASGATLEVPLNSGNELFGIVAAATEDVHVLAV